MYEDDRILLVDDDVTLLKAISRSLGDEFELEIAESGFRALELIESEGPFSVLVSDVKMPKMDGIELVSRVRESYPEMVSIILTGNQDEDTAYRATEVAKVFRMLNKPSPRGELVEAIEKALELYHSERTTP